MDWSRFANPVVGMLGPHEAIRLHETVCVDDLEGEFNTFCGTVIGIEAGRVRVAFDDGGAANFYLGANGIWHLEGQPVGLIPMGGL